jgi:hypothetical protein
LSREISLSASYVLNRRSTSCSHANTASTASDAPAQPREQEHLDEREVRAPEAGEAPDRGEHHPPPQHVPAARLGEGARAVKGRSGGGDVDAFHAHQPTSGC